MRKLIALSFMLVAFVITGFAQADKIVGRWKTIDDDGVTAKSIVVIFKSTNGKYYGKIERILTDPNKKCTACEGANKNQPMAGLTIINGMVEKDGKLTAGTILDPNNGKIYYCNMWIEASTPDKLQVRGSLDKRGWLGRSQTWIRLK